jgi:hypothetical protein
MALREFNVVCFRRATDAPTSVAPGNDEVLFELDVLIFKVLVADVIDVSSMS